MSCLPLLCFLATQAPDPERLKDTLSALVRHGTPAPGVMVAVRAAAVPDSVYVGQQATYQVAVYISDELRLRLRRNPQIVPGEMRSIMAYDLAQPVLQERFELGTRYQVHVYRRAVFAVAPGIHTIAPSRLSYTLRSGPSLFSRDESRTEASDPIRIVAVEPPAAGRPPGYSGAVGRFAAEVRSSARHVTVGVPFTITVAIAGAGNIAMLPRPVLQVRAEAIAAGERVELDTNGVVLSGRKEFDWVVTPRSPGQLAIPPVRYPYFDPHQSRYATAVTPELTVEVAAAPMRPDTLARPEESPNDRIVTALRRTFRGPLGSPLGDRPIFWFCLASIPGIAMTARGMWQARQRRASHSRRQHRAELETLGGDAAALRSACLAFLHQRLRLGNEIGELAVLERRLRLAGVSETTAQETIRLLKLLEAAAFAPYDPTMPNVAAEAKRLLDAVDREAISVESSWLTVAGLFLAVAAISVAQGAHALSEDRWGQLFVGGVVAFDSGRYVEARRNFRELGEGLPRSPDAWFNYGMASWALGDTGGAVLGWQRSVRLEPWAGDARRALRTLAPGSGLFYPVPPFPLDLLAIATALAWLAGWTYWAMTRRFSGFAVSLLALALALAGTVVLQRETLAGRDLAVVASSGAVRSLPAMGAYPIGSVRSGAVVRIVGWQGGWGNILLDGGHRGWLEADRLALLPAD